MKKLDQGIQKLKGDGQVVAKAAQDFTLQDENSKDVTLSEILKESHVLLAFYPGDFQPVCTQQLCNYRDNLDRFAEFGLKIYGVSHNSPASHKEFIAKYDLPFSLLTDPDSRVAKNFGCQSIWMFGRASRAVFIVHKNSMVLYRYVEPTIITRRKADEIELILADLKRHGLL